MNLFKDRRPHFPKQFAFQVMILWNPIKNKDICISLLDVVVVLILFFILLLQSLIFDL